MEEVTLVVYDLSHGMARTLSAQFLGHQHAIDIIPHTALVVFGHEYFYGGGIQAIPPHEFRSMSNLHPMQSLSLGKTSVSKQDFDRWCQVQMQTGQYNAAAYDLLHRNCNNFSHDAALQGLKLSQGVPEWILKVPQTFLSSPMGQMVRPMLENMQMTGNNFGNNVAPFASFGSTAASASQQQQSPSQNVVSISSAGASDNPWAAMDTKASSDAVVHQQKPTTSTSSSAKILHKYSKPFLSDDAKSVPICIQKVSSSISDPEQIQAIQQALLGHPNNENSSSSSDDDDVLDTALSALLELLYSYSEQSSSSSSSSLTFCLMLLRLVALQYPSHAMMAPILEWIPTQLQQQDNKESSSPLAKSIPARSMAWCIASNHRASVLIQHTEVSSSAWVGTAVDCALADLSSAERPEIRQAASCFLYNHVLVIIKSLSTAASDELDDGLVSILCGVMEGVVEEVDSVTQLRRLLIVGQLIKSVPAAKTLFVDLGFADTLQEISASTSCIAEENKALAFEIVNLV